MKEDFLHHIWKEGVFRNEGLHTHRGEEIRLLQKGEYHCDAGPDFKGASIEIGGMRWHGNVEIHLKSSDWHRHGHQSDPSYNSVILHVVWQHDKAICYPDGGEIPTLELCSLVDPNYLKNYNFLRCNLNHIACGGMLHQLSQDELQRQLMEQGVERLHEKVGRVETMLKQSLNHWEDILRRLMFRAAGMRVNASPMEELGAKIDIRLVEKGADILQTESLFFGLSGLLHQAAKEDDYSKELKERYFWLQKKYGLQSMSAGSWKYLRMRPFNFPDLRIAQLAAIFNKHPRLFEECRLLTGPENLKSLLRSEASTYWKTHYRLHECSRTHPAQIGESALNTLLINAVAPVLYAYGELRSKSEMKASAIDLLRQLPAEQHALSREWSQLGHPPLNALASQGLLHRNNHFCKLKRCLNCKSGQLILERYGRN